ncbi:DUF5050 domain-containing protein [Pendulispora albinea]|uniref:DUF5050 domain-containing protein n=1 Tax=Pendulispora albinea TaxID=2741071 RepID=A0ABZ2LXB3_9BACT
MVGVAVLGIGIAAAWVACNEIVGNESPTRVDPSGPDGEVDAPVARCDGGTCGQDACDGPCVIDCREAMVTDPDNHCGSCERSCLGGKCEDGGCTPVEVSEGSYPLDVLVDPASDGYVYWATGNNSGPSRILRRPKSLQSPPETVFEGGTQLFSPPLGMAGDHLYWLMHGPSANGRTTVNWANKDGSSWQSFEPEGNVWTTVAQDPAALYWTALEPKPAIRRWPLGADPSKVAAWWLEPGPGNPASRRFLAIEAEPGPNERIFWLESDGVYRIEKNGTRQKLLAHDFYSAPGSYLAVTKSDIYFVTSDNQIVRMNHDGECPGEKVCPEVIVPSYSPKNVRALTIDDDKLYWGVYPDGYLMRIDLDGTHLVTLAKVNNGGVVGIAFDDRAIYFLSGSRSGKGSVWRMAK